MNHRPKLIAMALLLAFAPSRGRADDASAQYSFTNNPSGAWTYGRAGLPGAPVIPLTGRLTGPTGLQQWVGPVGLSVSRTCSGLYLAGIAQPAGALALRPPAGGAVTVLRWTAPTTATYRLNAVFTGLAQAASPTTPQNLAGSQASAQLGRAVANAGDVNGDGIDDLLVGEPLYDGGQTDEGRVRLFLGSSSGPSATAAWSYESNQAGAQLGASVAGLGDVNGDGYADVVVGAPLWDAGGSLVDAGEALVFFGSPGGLAATPGWVAIGAVAGDHLGASVAGAGDVNGDGFADVLIGAPLADHGQADEGRAAIWYGSAGGLGPNGTFSNFGWGIESNQSNAQLGTAVAGIGDVNGDGYADIAVGAPLWDAVSLADAGRVQVYFGGAAGPSASWTHDGTTAGEKFGGTLARIGDVNGDGYADLLVGSPDYAFGQGKADLYRGSATGPGASAAQTITAGLAYGSSIAGLGDVDHDGYADVAIGEVSGFGTVRFYRGSAAGTLLSTAISWTGGPGYDVGRAIAGGDWNSDAQPDLALGQPLYDSPSTDAGRVTVIRQIVAGVAPRTTCGVGVYDDATALARATIHTTSSNTYRFSFERNFTAGQHIDFEVDDGGDGTLTDAVQLDVLALTTTPVSAPVGPAVAFAGGRFAVSRGPRAFETAAFDPIHRHLASQNSILDLCNNLLVANASPGAFGLAWDAVTGRYLSLDSDGNGNYLATHYDANGVLVDTLFLLPKTFNVPGIGPDTLESARGIAVDAANVYIVDAGPPNVQPYQNAWFKLTRAGVPVAGRKGASFAINTTGDVIDDIVYSPPGCPTAPGGFIVPVEHTGLFVLDASGAQTLAAPWSAVPGASTFRPSAFAGLALDPVKGDLWLVDNDRGLTQVWTRLAGTGVARSVISNGASAAHLRDPEGGCDNPLWYDFGGASCGVGLSLLFGIAYRPADERVYGLDYLSGDLWRFEPLSGRTERVVPTGRGGLWGMACDLRRDMLFSFDQGAQRLVRIDPRIGDAANLGPVTGYQMDDLAYVPGLDAVMGVDHSTSTPRLVSFNPVSGAATVVATTHDARGLEYDPSVDALLATSASNELWQIDPRSGAATFVKTLEAGEGWEGIAVAPVAPLSLADAPIEGPAPATFALRVGPNPAHADAVVRFSLGARGPAEVRVYDVAGRLVRRFGSGALEAGEHSLAWDGRDARGNIAGPGMYFVRLIAGRETQGAKLVRVP